MSIAISALTPDQLSWQFVDV